MAADGSGAMAVTQNGASRAPCWSPDGGSLAFISGHKGTFDLWVAPVPAAPPAAGEAAGPPAALQLTRGAALDTVSGLSWTGSAE